MHQSKHTLRTAFYTLWETYRCHRLQVDTHTDKICFATQECTLCVEVAISHEHCVTRPFRMTQCGLGWSVSSDVVTGSTRILAGLV